MLINREPTAQKKTQFRIRMSAKIYDQVTQYCQWAGINKRDFFIEEACKYILAHDTEWLTYKQSADFVNVVSLPNNSIAITSLRDGNNEQTLTMNELIQDN
ncbi:Uncharacterised protein [Legionella beliardensis]|uniref:Uncharacterized protein n=1 Tax=Legionella beliardensis TaxID=91822 RepID=A0A378I4B9_9GAMM|nr:hypothetical protein [Legionella beliardensis]STX30057.1 Uncharacterised protein [Legionella beliardensis]